ncbi:MAG: response regulator [Sphingomonadales bacterium]|nr:response regulator [Sphingomonadales bacterium]
MAPAGDAVSGILAADPADGSDGEARPGALDGLAVGAALVASLGLVWLVTHQVLVVAGFGGGLAVFAALARFVALRSRAPLAAELAEPDWAVTVVAIARPDCAVAITDRAGRLVCANATYEDWFGVSEAPPRLALDSPSVERLGEAHRIAWRDGAASVAGLRHLRALDRVWHGEIERAGRGDDFLCWRLTPAVETDPVAELAAGIAGKPGAVLAAAGIAAAIVDPDGAIRSASAGFADRATGDPAAAMAGSDFVAQLAQDEDGRLYWSRDNARSGPITLYHLPLIDPDLRLSTDPQSVPSLMLLADSGAGIGGDNAGGGAVPHLDALLEQLPVGLAMADRSGHLLFANSAFLRAAGREGKPLPIYPGDLVAREDKAALADAIHRHARGSANSGDLAVRLAAQPEEPVSLSLAGVRGLGEAAVLLSLADSTEETRLKRQVAQATKMQAVGQLAGGVAHDFNNILTAIIGTCDLMMLRHMPGDSDYDDIQQIRASSNRAASMTRQLLAFSRQQTLRPQVLQLPDVVTEISQMLKRLIGEKIQLVVTHDRNLGAVRADPSQIEQVIVNLVINARDAIHEYSQRRGGDGSGRLTLATRRITAADIRAMRNEVIPVADYTALVVEDSGGGIAPDKIGKIFEPFFTTKEQGKGTGLGLSTAYGIVKQSGGFIFAESEEGRGARFSIYLPVHHGPAEIAPARREEAAAWAGGGEILLVEDEDSVRMVAERALVRAGYKVTAASDGEEGLDRFAERAASNEGLFDLIVSDVVMPGLDGPAMIRRMRAKAPGLPVLFMSGHAEEQLRRELDIEHAQFLAKPFSVQQLTDKVAQTLGASAARGER